MEPIEEQWNPPSPPNIMSDLWMNIKDAKKAIKIWILDRSEARKITKRFPRIIEGIRDPKTLS
jgi:hypothetical protein